MFTLHKSAETARRVSTADEHRTDGHSLRFASSICEQKKTDRPCPLQAREVAKSKGSPRATLLRWLRAPCRAAQHNVRSLALNNETLCAQPPERLSPGKEQLDGLRQRFRELAIRCGRQQVQGPLQSSSLVPEAVACRSPGIWCSVLRKSTVRCRQTPAKNRERSGDRGLRSTGYEAANSTVGK